MAKKNNGTLTRASRGKNNIINFNSKTQMNLTRLRKRPELSSKVEGTLTADNSVVAIGGAKPTYLLTAIHLPKKANRNQNMINSYGPSTYENKVDNKRATSNSLHELDVHNLQSAINDLLQGSKSQKHKTGLIKSNM